MNSLEAMWKREEHRRTVLASMGCDWKTAGAFERKIADASGPIFMKTDVVRAIQDNEELKVPVMAAYDLGGLGAAFQAVQEWKGDDK